MTGAEFLARDGGLVAPVRGGPGAVLAAAFLEEQVRGVLDGDLTVERVPHDDDGEPGAVGAPHVPDEPAGRKATPPN